MHRSETGQTRSDSLDRRRPATGATGGPSTAVDYVRSGLNSGAIAGVLGVLTIIRARRTLLAGSSDSAIRQAMLAVFWIGVAMTQWGMNRSNRRAARDIDFAGIDEGELSTP